MKSVERGREGEHIARMFLETKGYVIVDANYRMRVGELDLVAEKEGVLVFVEVKSRRSDAFSNPGDSVTVQKQRRLRAVASYWMAQHGANDKPARFDVVEILHGLSYKAPRIHHIENAF